MRYILINNWSILVGFMLAVFSIVGMAVTVFRPVSLTFDLPTEEGISALEVPLRPINVEPKLVNEQVNAESKPLYIRRKVENADRESSSQIVLSTQDQKVEPQMVEDETLKPENYTETQLPPEVPVRILIPSINLDAPVIAAPVNFEKLAGKEFMQWLVPDQYASGWHTTSAMLGETGNTVLNGHHNAFGEVFVSLVDANIGEIIWVEGENSRFSYQITNKIIVPEKYEQLDVRMNNAQWILPTIDERLTLITCWPYETNTHRLIVVARPLGQEAITHNYR